MEKNDSLMFSLLNTIAKLISSIALVSFLLLSVPVNTRIVRYPELFAEFEETSPRQRQGFFGFFGGNWNEERETPQNRFIYKSCNVNSVSLGEFFIDELKLEYENPNGGNANISELKFMGPIPPFARVMKYELWLDDKHYKSVTCLKTFGEEVYENAKDNETSGKATVDNDVFSFSLKPTKSVRNAKKVKINLTWQQKTEVFTSMVGNSERRYIFPRSSYFKYGIKDRSNSNWTKNEYGLCDFDFEIDFSHVKDWEVDYDEKEFKKEEFKYMMEKSEKDDDIVFSLKMEEEPRVSVSKFAIDDINVYRLITSPTKDVIRNSVETKREIVLVVDKSYSMEFTNSSTKPYEIVAKAVDVFMSTVSNLDVYVNIVFFSHKTDVLMGRSTKINGDNIQKYKRDANEKVIPDGGTDILKALRKAVDCIGKTGEDDIEKSIVLLTDGGDGNLKQIKEFVSKEVKNEIRFYSIGIGGCVSIDTIKAVADLGNGSYDLVREVKDVGDCLSNVLEKTGGKKISYEYDSLKTEEEGIINYINKGAIKMNTEVVQVPSRKSVSKIFTNERRVLYLVTKKQLDGITIQLEEKYNIPVEEIEVFDGQVKDALRREFFHSVDEEFFLQFSEMIDERIKGYPGFIERRDEGTLTVDEMLQMFSRTDDFWKVYRNKIHMNINENLQTGDTIMMIGDGLADKDKWEDYDNQKLAKQYTKTYIHWKDEYSRHPFYMSMGGLRSLGYPAFAYLQADSCAELDCVDGPSVAADSCSSRVMSKSARAASTPVKENKQTSEKQEKTTKKSENILSELTEIFEQSNQKSLEYIAPRINELLEINGINSPINDEFIKKVYELAKEQGISLRGEKFKLFALIQIVTEILGVSSKESSIFVDYQRAALKRSI